MSTVTTEDLRRRYADLHRGGTFLIPNPYDVGSAVLLAGPLGFPALATTSSGLAATLGLDDQQVTREVLVEHVTAVCAAVDVPVQVDAEDLFPRDPGGVERSVELLAQAGAAGVSLEDYDQSAGRVLPLDDATTRVRAAATVAHEHGMLLTVRCENFLYDAGDLHDTVTRLTAYRDAGGDVLYAPGITSEEQVRAVVGIGAPVNVLQLPGGPHVSSLRGWGVRRVSLGGALAWAAYGEMVRAAGEFAEQGTMSYADRAVSREHRDAFGRR
ncbi:isocitrate lyase/phosphoenolpyruvate mutase family protein [Allobranchiibius sp. GilTou73]|uniref:isocitrate lyase/PEP mutase family protein n=1 Tax=Allobranchiibius sp. GilTou73 TaxID=2904523 RepID=UPI001F28912E|nr:isocitrate lyase/phosphoenolpyruvate mutase family protein [Allobranchiibius sp. GilTou73]UIJ33671.1 isocitrate lyase/phosphoenolpyruvate mutase family protein [Allobranchiibius sp. GilTou73]